MFEREVGISRNQLCDESWSIIIPALNEEKNIQSTLSNVENVCVLFIIHSAKNGLYMYVFMKVY